MTGSSPSDWEKKEIAADVWAAARVLNEKLGEAASAGLRVRIGLREISAIGNKHAQVVVEPGVYLELQKGD